MGSIPQKPIISAGHYCKRKNSIIISKTTKTKNYFGIGKNEKPRTFRLPYA
jgi:hypothetical protein